jgi:hypothetical protein
LAVMMALEYGAGINLWWPSAVVFKAIWGGGMVRAHPRVVSCVVSCARTYFLML